MLFVPVEYLFFTSRKVNCIAHIFCRGGKLETSADHRDNRARRSLPRGVPFEERVRKVHGIKRRASLFNTDRIDHLYQGPHDPDRRLILHYGDLTDSTNLIRIVQEVQPDEIYNLAAQSHVKVSFETPEFC
jgi:hypothetical protein